MKKLLLIPIVLFFYACNQDLNETQKQEYMVKGKKIAQTTAEAMLQEVVKNMKEGGVAQAVPFCNAHASQITNEFATKSGVEIKRTSHLLRNEKNAPNQREQEVIEMYLSQKPDALKPMVEKNKDGSVQFYAPITLLDKCTVCHGILGETLEAKNDSITKFLYPNDKAIGFKPGDIRGIWSIKFPKK